MQPRSVAHSCHHHWDALLYSCYVHIRMSWDDLTDASVPFQGSRSWHGDPRPCPLPGSQRYFVFAAAISFYSTIIVIDVTFPRPADDFQSSVSAPLVGGIDSLLSGEDDDEFFDLHIVKNYSSEVSRRLENHQKACGRWMKSLSRV